MENTCNHYPWSAVNEPCPNCEQKECNHYPWSSINEQCPQCGNHNHNHKETFYCVMCNKYTKHISICHNVLTCEKCDTTKINIYFSNTHNQPNIYMTPYNNISSIGRKCPNCNIHNIKYMVARFTYTTNGLTYKCIDTNRPMCENCHHLVCEDITHSSCVSKVLRSNL